MLVALVPVIYVPTLHPSILKLIVSLHDLRSCESYKLLGLLLPLNEEHGHNMKLYN